MLPDVSKQVSLIVNPKDKQSVEKTKEGLNKVNPVCSKITNVETNWITVIQSERGEEKE